MFVNVHRAGASPMPLPFGGFKQSGVGRHHGLESVFARMEQPSWSSTTRRPSLAPITGAPTCCDGYRVQTR